MVKGRRYQRVVNNGQRAHCFQGQNIRTPRIFRQVLCTFLWQLLWFCFLFSDYKLGRVHVGHHDDENDNDDESVVVR